MPKIYVADLAAYNDGILHGAWVDASPDVEEMQEAVNKMLRESPCPNVTVTDPDTGEQVPSAEEYAIHDYDEMPACFGEYTGLREIADYAALLEAHPFIDPEEMALMLANFQSVGELREALEERFAGIYPDKRTYVEEVAEGYMENASEYMRRYFDYAALLRDLETEESFVELSGGRYAIFYA